MGRWFIEEAIVSDSCRAAGSAREGVVRRARDVGGIAGLASLWPGEDDGRCVWAFGRRHGRKATSTALRAGCRGAVRRGGSAAGGGRPAGAEELSRIAPRWSALVGRSWSGYGAAARATAAGPRERSTSATCLQAPHDQVTPRQELHRLQRCGARLRRAPERLRGGERHGEDPRAEARLRDPRDELGGGAQAERRPPLPRPPCRPGSRTSS